MSAVLDGRSFDISKMEVFDAYRLVAANRGSCGVDGQGLIDFEQDLRGNLYRIWNRLTSGSYFPPPVRRVEIPKGDGGMRPLGIPTVGDRIAQMVVKRRLEPVLEPLFHRWSFGYRPGRSALDAVGLAREQCWKRNWVVDVDIKGFFDAIPHDLLLKAVDRHCPDRWVRLYISRWLTAPVAHADGTREARTSGTPQGGVISPLLANLFLHYAFDTWMERTQSCPRFERYADDIVCHCWTREQAFALLAQLRERFAACGLTLHPAKCKVVCTGFGGTEARFGDPAIAHAFDFLGYTFCWRTVCRRNGTVFRNFTPGMSRRSEGRIRQVIRTTLSRSSTAQNLGTLACDLNRRLRGWYAYFSAYSPALVHQRIGFYLNGRIRNWAQKKYRRFKECPLRTWRWFQRLQERAPTLFWHWTATR